MDTKEKLIKKLKKLNSELIKIDNDLFEMYGHESKSPGAILAEATYSISSVIAKLDSHKN